MLEQETEAACTKGAFGDLYPQIPGEHELGHHTGCVSRRREPASD